MKDAKYAMWLGAKLAKSFIWELNCIADFNLYGEAVVEYEDL